MRHLANGAERGRLVNTKNNILKGPSIADFIWERATKPEFLWHYTGGAGLLGIANTNSLWCTEYRFLNDRQEIAHFAQRVQNSLAGALTQFLSEKDIDLLVGASSLYETYHVFICSFCSDADKNEHWHQYARRAGYALGFDPDTLRTIAKSQDFQLSPVIYDEEAALKIAKTVIEDRLPLWMRFKSPLSPEDRQQLSRSINGVVLGYAPFFKPAAFRTEREWRLTKVTGLNEAGISYRPSKPFGLLAYYNFNFKVDNLGKRRKTGGAPKKLIGRVLTGPGSDADGWTRATNAYHVLNKAGFEPLVSESKSSLRFID
jgi:hypothetical protein